MERVYENCTHCIAGRKSLFFTDFIYFDAKGDHSRKMFAEEKLRIFHFQKTVREGEVYELNVARVRKKDVPKFLEIMGKLENKLLLLGYRNYIDYCKEVFDRLDRDKFEYPERA